MSTHGRSPAPLPTGARTLTARGDTHDGLLDRRQFLAGAGATAFAGSALLQDGPAQPSRPNVLFLMADQHRHDVAGFAGDEHAVTPNLDRLAAGSVRVSDAYCQSPLCVPARQSLVTGLYAHGHGTFENRPEFPAGQATLAKRLAAAGYQTALLGKSHCNTDGFELVRDDEALFEEFRATHPRGTLPRSYTKSEGGDKFDQKVAQMNPWTKGKKPGVGEFFHMEAAVADEAQRFFAERDRVRPFFVWASLLAPHPPLFPPDAWLDRFRNAKLPFHRPIEAEEESALFALERGLRRRLRMAALDADDLLGITRSYYAALAWTDHNIGRILDALERAGLAGDTLVVYTSDHGEMLGEHGLLRKRTLFEGASRVPLLFRFPGRLGEGTTVRHVVQHVDVTPTICELMGVEPDAAWHGRSMVQLLREKGDADWTDLALCELIGAEASTQKPVPTRRVPRSAIYGMLRLGRYKYVRHTAAEEALYDLSEDPGETHNLVGRVKHAERTAMMRARLDQAMPETIEVVGGEARARRR